ncbi:UvrD-helicase domain-containing protein [Streptomyces sp. M10(2022)]
MAGRDRPGRPEQVLGLTFTNKAAGELAERVRKALVAAGVTDPDTIDPDNPRANPPSRRTTPSRDGS